MRQLLMLILTSTLLLTGASSTPAQPTGPAVPQRFPDSSQGEWRSYAGNIRGENYSPLTEINESNFANLERAWEWTPLDDYPSTFFQQTSPPLMIDGALYFTTPLSQGVAIDAVTGETLWVYNPPSYQAPTTRNPWPPPGVAYWTDDEGNERIFWGTRGGHLICVGPKTGRPCPGFGSEDTRTVNMLADPSVALPFGFASSPIVVGDTVILSSPTSSAGPPDALRWLGAWDVYTGETIWSYPEGTDAASLWDARLNPWIPITPSALVADDDLGLVYMPISVDYNQGDTPLSATLVALDVNTGEPRWHHPTSAADRFRGYDFPSHPNLVDIPVNDSLIPAIAQVTSQGTVYVLDRATGAPIWPEVRAALAFTDAFTGLACIIHEGRESGTDGAC